MSARRYSIAHMRAALATTALVALGGCTTLGGNIKGSFSCAAPDGICAPSSSIDDRALTMIAGESGTTETIPAGPVIDPGARARPTRTAATGPRVAIGQGDPRRTQERVLRIVFQPYIDEFGRLHEASAVHAVVEIGGWQQQRLAASTPIPDLSAAPRVVPGPSLADVVDRADRGGTELAAIDPNLPDPAVVAAARARAPAADPVTAIKDDVAARLAPMPGRTPRRAVSKSVAKPLERKAGGAAATVMVAKGSTDVGAATKSPPPAQAGAPLVAKSTSAPEAAARVKATTAYQAGAVGAQNGAREAAASAPPTTKPTTNTPVRATSFPSGVLEDN